METYLTDPTSSSTFSLDASRARTLARPSVVFGIEYTEAGGFLISIIRGDWQKLTGYQATPPESFLQAIIAHVAPESQATLRTFLSRLRAGDSSLEAEVQFFDSRNESLYLRFTPLPTTESIGPCTEILVADISTQVLEEQRVLENTERLAWILDATEEAYWDWNIKADRHYFSPRFYSMLGFRPDEFQATYQSWRKLIHPEDIAAVEQKLDEHFAAKSESYLISFRMMSKNGAYRWIQSRGKVIVRGWNNKPVRMVGTNRDITSEKLIERGLQESESLYRALFEHSPYAVSLTRADGRYVDVNDNFLLSTGLAREEVIGKTPVELGFLTPEDRERILAEIDLTGRIDQYEINIKLRGGTEHRTLLISARQIVANGEPLLVSMINDITVRKQAENKLAESQAMLQAVLDTIPVRVFWKDLNLHYLGGNQAFALDAGFQSPAELLGKTDFETGWKEQAELYRSDDRAVIESEERRLNYEEPQRTPDGRSIWLRTSKVPLRNSHGEIIGVLGTYDDITERKNMEDQLARAEKMQALGLLAGGVAHDLNNTLGPLVGYPELMLRQLPADSPLRKMVMRIERSATDAVNIIQDLLTLARRGRYDLRPTSLNDVVREYLDSPHYLRISSEKSGIQLVTQFQDNLPLIAGSSAHLSKVIMNVIGNAYEAMQDSGEIVVKTSSMELARLQSGNDDIVPGSYVIVRIKDTGHGIAREDLQKIFEPYFSRKTMGKSGSGLGLAVVYGVVKDHNGYYDVFSEVGKGTEFVFYFPTTEQVAGAETQATPAESRKTRVLVVDDSAEQRTLALYLISSLGYSVAAVANGHEALAYLAQQAVDVVVLDMVMEPGFDGLETYREILKIHTGQKAIIGSGFAETERVRQMQEIGAGPFICKPYSAEKFARALAEVLHLPVPTERHP